MNGNRARRDWHLRQITFGDQGHTLNHRQIFSPGGQRAYFDTRNADPDIGVTERIQCIDLGIGEIRTVYALENNGPFGPGVGAVVCHPHAERLTFIHGLRNCDADRPYAATRRFGAWIDPSIPGMGVRHAESRCVDSTCSMGVLRGGSHAHSWSGDGRAISFTYNDAVMESRHRRALGPPDLRTVGVMFIDHPTQVPNPDDENFGGECWSMVVAALHHNPKPGSDEIESAREECWIGRTSDAVAFVGRVRGIDGRAVDELFVAEWTDRLPGDEIPAPTDAWGRLVPPSCVSVRRVTRTGHRRYPGIDGPRHWLLSSPDGRVVYATLRDDQGIAQLFGIDVPSGELRPMTQLEASIENPIAINPEGNRISLVSKGRIGIVDLKTMDCSWSPDLSSTLQGIPGAVHFLPNGSGLLFHATAKQSVARWQQLWTLSLH
jgi:hypothetical protein